MIEIINHSYFQNKKIIITKNDIKLGNLPTYPYVDGIYTYDNFIPFPKHKNIRIIYIVDWKFLGGVFCESFKKQIFLFLKESSNTLFPIEYRHRIENLIRTYSTAYYRELMKCYQGNGIYIYFVSNPNKYKHELIKYIDTRNLL